MSTVISKVVEQRPVIFSRIKLAIKVRTFPGTTNPAWSSKEQEEMERALSPLATLLEKEARYYLAMIGIVIDDATPLAREYTMEVHDGRRSVWQTIYVGHYQEQQSFDSDHRRAIEEGAGQFFQAAADALARCQVLIDAGYRPIVGDDMSCKHLPDYVYVENADLATFVESVMEKAGKQTYTDRITIQVFNNPPVLFMLPRRKRVVDKEAQREGRILVRCVFPRENFADIYLMDENQKRVEARFDQEHRNLLKKAQVEEFELTVMLVPIEAGEANKGKAKLLIKEIIATHKGELPMAAK